MSFSIEQLSSEALPAALPDLVRLLQDAVDGGASVGFLPPLSMDEATSYWESVLASVQGGGRVLLVARQGGAVVGSVQLALEQRPNGRHRAEVQKLLVHRAARRQGIARALMAAIEDTARQHDRSLLVLDTLRGDAAEQLYRQIGYVEAGEIPRYARGADGALHATVVFYRMV
jgi:ribosomal protein S18 acetylase RimI-like enzyme